ncbi:MAG: sugar phosphate isomerase/epimerase [Verrucomicrobia bacterium]|nr:sugar phosphate isomerase/epimerase [Verrucomicrobiota bacterium]MDA1066480.1 sugar phosphate isomerase/epimerase [Verrucomicrobiota bacterium]
MKNDDMLSSHSSPDRRTFLKGVSGALAGAALLGSTNQASAKSHSARNNKSITPMPLATNSYPWGTFYKRQGRDYDADLAFTISEIKKSGADCLEPNLKSLDYVDTLSSELQKQDLGMISVYVNSELHEAEKAKESIDWAMAIVRRAKKRMGTKIVVTNPSPIRWGGPENKTDDQLAVQRDALEDLGKAIHSEGMSLAYHFHDPEFREGAREVHHMLSATNPEYVKLCLDAHWAFRGAGDSNVALHDIVKLYGDRIVELHIRQSRDGIWTEAFGDGDIDYVRLTRELVELGVSPLVTMEQAVEEKSLDTMDALAAHEISHAKSREVFAPFIG